MASIEIFALSMCTALLHRIRYSFPVALDREEKYVVVDNVVFEDYGVQIRFHLTDVPVTSETWRVKDTQSFPRKDQWPPDAAHAPSAISESRGYVFTFDKVYSIDTNIEALELFIRRRGAAQGHPGAAVVDDR